MRKRITLLIFIAPLWMGTSCIQGRYYSYTFELSKCPDHTYTLPPTVDVRGWTLRAGEAASYCHGFFHYDLFKRETKKLGDAYVHFDRSAPCKLSVIALGWRREDSEDQNEALKLTTRSNAKTLVDGLLTGLNIEASLPPSGESYIGGKDSLEHWCRANANQREKGIK